jgi:cell division transport system permease protein
MLLSLKRIIKFGWDNFSRNFGASLAAVFVMVIVISGITSLYLFQRPLDYLLESIQERMDVSVYFSEDCLEDDILKASREISEVPEVKSVEYVSRDEAYRKFTERHQSDLLLMDSLEELGINPFLASLNIRAKDSSGYASIVSFIEKSEFQPVIEKVDYYQKRPMMEKLLSLDSRVRQIALVFSLIFAVIAFLVAFNQVQLSLQKAKEEISTMKLVGSPNWLIKGPFLVQGMIVGILASFVTLAVFWGGLALFNSSLEKSMPCLNIIGFFTEHFFFILILQLAVGIGIGAFASLAAIRKYLKV